MFEDLEDKVVVVTGAARGIGLAYAEAFLGAGCQVVISDVLVNDGEKIVAELRHKGHEVSFVACDVSSPEQTKALAAKTADLYGGIDVLVNNAAVWGDIDFVTVFEITPERWDKSFAVNVKGVWLTSIACAPFMKNRPGAVIINQASTAPYIATPRTADYSATKAAVITLTKTFAKSFSDMGIRVNAIAPGGIRTPAALNKSVNLFTDEAVAQQCVKHPGETDDLIGPLLFLASSASSYMSGQVLVVDGGKTMTA